MIRIVPLIIFLFTLVFFIVTERTKLGREKGDGERLPIHVWCTSVPAQTILEFTAQFEKVHPEYRVQVQTVAWNSLQEKTLWAVAAGSNVPDLILGSSEWTGGLANSGALEPLDEYLPKEFFDQYFASALGTYQFPFVDRENPGTRGEFRQYGIPLDLDMMLIFYRADVVDPVLSQLGMGAFPTDWESFLKLGAALYHPSRPNVTSQHLLYFDPEDPTPLRMALLPSSGGMMFSHDLNRATFDSPESIAAFEFMDQMLITNTAREWNPTTQGDPMELIKSHRILGNISGPWFTKMLESKAPEQAGKWRVALFPRRTPECASTGLGGSCLAMPYNAGNKHGAIELAKYLASNEFSLAYYRKVGSPPPIKRVWDSPEFDVPMPYFGDQKVYQVVRQAIEESTQLQLLPNAQVTKQYVRWAMYEIATSDGDTTDIVKKAVSRANETLEQNR